MEEIRPLSGVSFNDLCDAWDDAFSEYVYSWTRNDIAVMLRRRGYVPGLSFGAFDGERLVSFTLNCLGLFGGKTTAYDTGTGTVKGYRGRGLASKIFQHALPYLKAAGAEQYLLEVLYGNDQAFSVYANTGFTVTRELNSFFMPLDELRLNDKLVPGNYHVRETTLSDGEAVRSMWDFPPAWQNSLESVERGSGDFVCLGVYENDSLIAYGITAPASGDITQLAVSKPYRRQGIASGLLKALLTHNKNDKLRVINIEKGCEAYTAFMADNGMSVSGVQYEMVREIV